jgi:hypothetical protein
MIERCICYFDLVDVDINSIVVSLRSHYMYSGFIYVYAYGLMDFGGAFQIAFEDMIYTIDQHITSSNAIKNRPNIEEDEDDEYDDVIITHSTSSSATVFEQYPSPEQSDIAYKLLLFMSYSAQSKAFPRGTETKIPVKCLVNLVRTICSETWLQDMSKHTTLNPLSEWVKSKKYPYLLSLAKVDFFALFYCLYNLMSTIYNQTEKGSQFHTYTTSNITPDHLLTFGNILATIIEFTIYGDKIILNQNCLYICFFEHFLNLIITCNLVLPMNVICHMIRYCKHYIKNKDISQEHIFNLISNQLRYSSSSNISVLMSLISTLDENNFYRSSVQLYQYYQQHYSQHMESKHFFPNSNTFKVAIQSYIQDRNSKYRMFVFSYIREYMQCVFQLNEINQAITSKYSNNNNDNEYLSQIQAGAISVLIFSLEELSQVNLDIMYITYYLCISHI